MFGVSSDEYLNYALNNRKQWEGSGRQVVEEMVESVKARHRHLQQQDSKLEEEEAPAAQGTMEAGVRASPKGRLDSLTGSGEDGGRRALAESTVLTTTTTATTPLAESWGRVDI